MADEQKVEEEVVETKTNEADATEIGTVSAEEKVENTGITSEEEKPSVESESTPEGSETKTVLEDLLAEEEKAEEDTAESGSKKGSWKSLLPKEYQEEVDVEKFPTFKSYLDALKAGAKAAEPEETEEDWTNLKTDLKTYENILDSNAIESFRTSGYRAKDIKPIADTVLGKMAEATKEKQKELERGYSEFELSVTHGDKKQTEKYRSTMRRGMEVFKNRYPQQFKDGHKDGVLVTGAAGALMYLLGEAEGEPASPRGSTPSASGKDILNPFGLKH